MSRSPSESERFDKLVVVGASAGGVEALSVLAGSLPADFPAPVVLAQHLDPNRPSQLATILERRSALKILTVRGKTPLEAGTIYVVPANRHVRISDGHVTLEADHTERPRPSVDRLLSTAAEAYNDRLVAVILTGSGRDGAAGAVDVKNAGGVVVIQNPETARFPSMPLALPPTVVDHVVELEGIGKILCDLVKDVDVSPTTKGNTDETLSAILSHVSQRASIDFRSYKTTTIRRRLARRMAVTGVANVEEYDQYLKSHPDEVAELVMSFLIKVTEFFRDIEPFDYLKSKVLPELINAARDRSRVLRIWSAGCATGEEAFSLAMLVGDLLGNERLEDWSIKIFATDLDGGAVNFARRGIYPESMLRELPKGYADRFFQDTDHGFQITKQLRSLVIFGQQDLGRGVPFPRIDLVICRNVLIYFKPELQQHVLDLFAYSLHQTNGYLFLGKAETTRPAKANYELVNKKWKLYRCLGLASPTAERGVARGTTTSPWRRTAAGRNAGDAEADGPAGETSRPPIDSVQLRHFNELLFRHLPIGIVVVDRGYRMSTANASARRLLGIRETPGEKDFLHAARALPYQEVRNSIDHVFREHAPVTLTDLELDTPGNDRARFATLSIVPLQMDPGVPEAVLISVADRTEEVQSKRRLESAQAEQASLVGELGNANKQLAEINKELLDANQELQASNEELMLAQEEFQSTNEELEATNEEFQATNEELETSNEELESTNEELQTTNDELTSRTAELQELSRALATERVRLTEMIEQAPFQILVLRGPMLTVEAFNPRFRRLIEEQHATGRPLDEVFHDPRALELLALAKRAYREGTAQISARIPFSLADEEAAAGQAHYFVYTIVPTHDSVGQVHGIVIYGEDVTKQMATEGEEQRAQFELMIEHVDQVALALYDVRSNELIQASPRYLDLLERARGLSRNSIVGRKWQETSILGSSENAADPLASVRSTGVACRLLDVHLRLDDAETIWDCSFIPITSPETGRSTVRFVVVAAIEVTQQARAVEELQRVTRLKDQFFSVASHELRTPLVPLMGYADLLSKALGQKSAGTDQDRKLGEIAGKIRRQVDRLDRIVDDLLDVARLQTGKFSLNQEPVNLLRVLQQASEDARLSAEHPKVYLDVHNDDGPYEVIGDEGRLVQVVFNLLQNGSKHAPDSDRIDLRLYRAQDLVTVSAGSSKRRAPSTNGERGEVPWCPSVAVIEVEDHGPGIANADLASIFDRYFQAPHQTGASKEGLGLGLFISKQIVEQHGGTIAVDSVVGKGTKFSIRLPLATKAV